MRGVLVNPNDGATGLRGYSVIQKVLCSTHSRTAEIKKLSSENFEELTRVLWRSLCGPPAFWSSLPLLP